MKSHVRLSLRTSSFIASLFAVVVMLIPPVASASHTWNVSSGVPRHWQRYGPDPSSAVLLDKTTGTWPSHVASAVSTWNSGSTTFDFFRSTGSDCGVLPDGYATICNGDFGGLCGSDLDWVGCTDSLGVNSQTGHWVKLQVRFDDNVSGFTWTDAKRQEVACHELGHVLGLWHGQPTGCLESVATGNYTTPATHDYEQANSNHNHTDCVPPCQGLIDGEEGEIVYGGATAITVQELLLLDLGTPPFLMDMLLQ